MTISMCARLSGIVAVFGFIVGAPLVAQQPCHRRQPRASCCVHPRFIRTALLRSGFTRRKPPR